MVSRAREIYVTTPARRKVVIAAIVVAACLLLALFTQRTEVRLKSMIDNGSEGIDYLNIAYRNVNNPDDAALLLAAENFAQLRMQLDHWAWVITATTVAPPVRNQFRALEVIAGAGSSLVAAPGAAIEDGPRRFGQRGTIADLCLQAERLDSLGGTMFDQLSKSRDELKLLISNVTAGECT
ncbi:MAG: hypothetical protein WD208_03730 [Dehalococcoidia bacterium]